ncbi:MAG: hypothetical protein KQH83_09600 [Actinobacteria bacterium]|nr:hypothetical protein [Actinomycetota bacterium]
MTRRIPRTAIVLAVVAAVAFGAAPVALAQDDAPAGETTATTAASFEPGAEPAVVVTDPAADDADPAWTFRYLVPTAITLSALVLAGFAVGYGVRIKGRYRVAR